MPRIPGTSARFAHTTVQHSRPRPAIMDAFPNHPDTCQCLGTGTVCEDHPAKAWGPIVTEAGLRAALSACFCGAAGQPCGATP